MYIRVTHGTNQIASRRTDHDPDHPHTNQPYSTDPTQEPRPRSPTLNIYPTVVAALFGSNGFERVSSIREELPVGTIAWPA